MSGRDGHTIPDGLQGIAAFRPSSVAARAILVLAVLGTPVTARAFDKAVCVDSHESAQKSLKAGRERESKEQLLVCADPSCPALVREDCETWLSNLDRQRQSATTGEARAEPGPESGPSHANIPSEPATGDHDERDRSSAAREDEPRSRAPQDHGSPANAEPPTPQMPAAPMLGTIQGHDAPSPGHDVGRVPATQPRHSVSAAAWVTGAIALASFGTAAAFGVTGWLDARSLRETCAPNCPSSRVSSVRQNLLMADISTLTGVTFSAVTAWLVWSHKDAGAHEESKSEGARLSASMTGNSFRLDYAASF